MWATHGLAVALALSVLPGGRALRPGDCEGTAGPGGPDSTLSRRGVGFGAGTGGGLSQRDLPQEGPTPGMEDVTWGEEKLGPGGPDNGLTWRQRGVSIRPPTGQRLGGRPGHRPRGRGELGNKQHLVLLPFGLQFARL